MDKVTVGSIADSKPSMVVSTQVAATPTIGAGELAIWAGTDVRDNNQIKVLSALRRLRDHLRENQFPVGALAINMAHFTPDNGAILSGNFATFPGGMTEADVMIAYGATFYDAGNSTNFLDIINRAIEVYQEQILKLN